MSLNTVQKAIIVVSAAVLLSLVLFPPWWQAAVRETAYRKELGRGWILRPPAPVPVDCYFVGCETAPASYFHVLLYRDLFFEQLATVIGVSLVTLWIFRARRDGTRASLGSPKTRLRFSAVMALLVTPEGKFPLASDLVDIPKTLLHRDELWLIPMIMVILMYLASVVIIYGLVSAVLWLRSSRFASVPGARY
jgi:hypothetical protein